MELKHDAPVGKIPPAVSAMRLINIHYQAIEPESEPVPIVSASPCSELTQPQRILLADDDEAVRFVVAKVLGRAGFQVTTVADGKQAMEALCSQEYDLLITDNEMPCLWGVELIELIREAGMKTPVIIASGSFPVERMVEYPHLRISAVLPKPFGIQEILEVVRHVLRRPLNQPSSEVAAFERAHLKDRVLIVDDDALVRGSLAAVLECEGFTVDEAENGLEAISRAIYNSPALILLDLNMPIMDGWTAFSKLDLVRPLVPIVVITARPGQYLQAAQVGVDAFMEKPLDIPILLDAIKRLANEDENSYVRRITDPNFNTELLGGSNP